jgi:hypothetical protein
MQFSSMLDQTYLMHFFTTLSYIYKNQSSRRPSRETFSKKNSVTDDSYAFI